MLDRYDKRAQRLKYGLAFFIIAGCALLIIGLSLISPAFAINSTGITDTLNELSPNIQTAGVFHAFWFFFLLICLLFFELAMFRMKEHHETVFFSIGALVLSVIITILFTSPLSFDIQESINIVEVKSNDTSIIEATVTNKVNQIILIPNDSEFRFMFVSLFTGLSFFNGLYTIFILTNYHGKK